MADTGLPCFYAGLTRLTANRPLLVLLNTSSAASVLNAYDPPTPKWWSQQPCLCDLLFQEVENFVKDRLNSLDFVDPWITVNNHRQSQLT